MGLRCLSGPRVMPNGPSVSNGPKVVPNGPGVSRRAQGVLK